MSTLFKHNSIALLLAMFLSTQASAETFDLLADGAAKWQPFDQGRWRFAGGELHGSTATFDGDKTDPDASTFLVGNRTFGGDYIVSIELTFDEGRYFGVYLDFGQDSQTGIWMASGHALAANAPANEVERGYIKTVENGFWIVRATGELVIEKGRRVKLGFSSVGDAYSLWNDGKLIAVYRKAGGYPAGPLQLRLTNSSIRIHKLQVRTGKGK